MWSSSHAPSSLSLGECLNLAVDSADGDVIAKFDDDDHYGEHYLADQVTALRYSAADLVGKQAHYMHLEVSWRHAAALPRTGTQVHELGDGPDNGRYTCSFHRRPLPARSPVVRIRRSRRRSSTPVAQSIRLIASISFRSGPHDGAHTWTVEQSELLANSVVHGFGLAPEHHFF